MIMCYCSPKKQIQYPYTVTRKLLAEYTCLSSVNTYIHVYITSTDIPWRRTASDMIISEKTLIVSLNDLPGSEVNKGKTPGLDQKT